MVGAPLTGSAAVTLACPPGQFGPFPPAILSVSQASRFEGTTSSVIICGVAQHVTTGAYPITKFKLYRSLSALGPFSLLTDTEAISAYVIVNQLYDYAPVFGTQYYYVATALDSQGQESAPSNVVFYTAALQGVIGSGNFSPAARGPYPLLGCDVFVDPTTGEGVIGPNGDLLTVNGLECLAQDLRIRILTEIGELRMHPAYGLSKDKVIGSGQAKPQVQAQIFRADIIDCLTAEPRVFQVLDVQISQSDIYSWIIAYEVMAINVEDPFRANLVYNYYGPTAVAVA
jgi:hypothetical protein